MLLEDVWNVQPPAYTNVVDVQIGNLRRKLDPTGNSRVIVSVRSVGFKFDGDHEGFRPAPQQTWRALRPCRPRGRDFAALARPRLEARGRTPRAGCSATIAKPQGRSGARGKRDRAFPKKRAKSKK